MCYFQQSYSCSKKKASGRKRPADIKEGLLNYIKEQLAGQGRINYNNNTNRFEGLLYVEVDEIIIIIILLLCKMMNMVVKTPWKR